MKRLAPFFLAVLAAAQTDVAQFLERNRQALDLKQFEPKLLDFRGRQIILLGESHGVADNEEIDLAFLKYLHREAGVRTYLAEWGYAGGLILNEYFETGDATLLDFLMAQSQNTAAWTKERRDFYEKFRVWNQSLPKSDRVRIVGVDVEHQRGLALSYLGGLARGASAKPSDAIAPMVARLRELPERAAPKSPIAADLGASFRDHRADYQTMLGNRYFDFELILTNIERANEYYAEPGSAKSHEIRERAIYDTFRKVYAHLGEGRWYGRWGSFHVLQAPADDRNRFADFLNHPDSPVAGKVASILAIYRNGMALRSPGYQAMPVIEQEVPVQPFHDASPSPVTLFRIAAPGSPFMRTMPGYFAGKIAPAKLVDYVLLVKDARASHPFANVPVATSEIPAVVVRSEPASGSRDVPLTLTEVRVTFSKEMRDRTWSWCQAGAFPPPPLKNVHYEADRRTIVGAVQLEPGRKYAIWLNTLDGSCSNFRDAKGQTSIPYLLSFETAAK